MKRMPARIQRGFTIVELVIVIVVVGTLAVAGVSMFSDTFTTTRVVNAAQSSGNDARYAVERLAREIREVKYIDATNGYSISALSSSGMTFVRTIDGVDVTVTVARSGSNLTLGYSSPAVTSTLSTQASAFTLDFLGLNLDTATGVVTTPVTASATSVRFVVISLTVTDAVSGQTITERSRVALRNT
jgi:prepilin-type N-terminal cleavage/methylation domain-containing protein